MKIYNTVGLLHKQKAIGRPGYFDFLFLALYSILFNDFFYTEPIDIHAMI